MIDSNVRASSYRENKGFLNSSELQYWSDNFRLDSEEKLPKKIKLPMEVWHLSKEAIINKVTD